MQEKINNTYQKIQKQKVAYFPWDFVGKIQNIYPEYEFIPIHKALQEKENIVAVLGFHGKGALMAKALGFDFWTVHEGHYRLLGHIPCSFMLERFGSYQDATKPSEWEEYVREIPNLFNYFQANNKAIPNHTLQVNFQEEAKGNSEEPVSEETETFSPFVRAFLDNLKNAFPALGPYDGNDAKKIITELLSYRLSSDKYAPDASPYQLSTPSGRKRVVILDEERQGKDRLKKIMASEKSFVEMLESAKKTHSGAAFFLLEPKSVRTHKHKGYLRSIAEANGVQVISGDVSSISILSQAEVVYTVGSQLGLDAILLGKKVYCFGMPFYAGWGLTKDIHTLERRALKRSKEELFAAFCLFFTRYRHPVTGEAGSFREILHFIILQRPLAFERKRYIACIHFDSKLEAFCKRFFAHADIHFLSENSAIKHAKEHNGMIFTAKEPNVAMRKACGNIPLTYVCTGVLDRLLGHDDYVSLSLEGGSYPSLERILQTVHPSESDLLRARLFRQYLRELSAFREHFDLEHIPTEQKVIILVGNRYSRSHLIYNLDKPNLTNSDAHEQYSHTSLLGSDANLIEHIRALRPYDYIIYCPQVENSLPTHVLKKVDDVKLKARPSDFVPLSILGLELNETEDADNAEKSLKKNIVEPSFIEDDNECYENYEGKSCTPWTRKYIASKRFLEKAHKMTTVEGQFCPLYFPVHSVQGHSIEVHTFDSYLGLDALSVGMDVFTYGWPFYAGWGLTQDAEDFPLRTRSINVETLFMGAFIQQPRYFDVKDDIFCEPENAPYLLMRDF